MPINEQDARYIKEYKISNRPEAVAEFHRLAEEVDSFLSACQTGEVDPHAFIRSLDDEGP